MASTIAPARVHAISPPWRRMRDALAKARTQGVAVCSAARSRFRRPALHIGAFTAFDVAAWHTFGLGAGLLVLGGLLLVWEFLGGDE